MAHNDAAAADRLITEANDVVSDARQFQGRLGVWVEEAQRQVRLNGLIEAKARSVLEVFQRSQLRLDLERLADQLEIADTLKKIQQNGELDLVAVSADIERAVAGIMADVQGIEQEREALKQAESLYAEGAKWTERSTEARYIRMVVTNAWQEVALGRSQLTTNAKMHRNLIRNGEEQESAVQPSSSSTGTSFTHSK
jgi:septum formation inhibitor MinC